ncbi:helicase [Vineibacter terrae]|uniref:Helicase n=1 Tax=Vineibacter terrae TaxID=2586908 RepID=A0A5C8PM00_9HYPH|nr:helicase-related protein [Vineibacter terrae]TXL74851.1 helicase [Vineibacter terrae]
MNASAPSERRLLAVLGPTNTGKTHLAMERLLGHESGMIGFPLRLLARENYDRAVRRAGAGAVALVTGEEKIQPPNARYYICTVESMPLERPVRFLAVDEIQMCADPERGHIFTDRLLRARGLDETMLLGADTMRPLLQRLFPDIEIIARPRFSTLSYGGSKKVTRLPARSAIVGFSASEVYALAELVRRQRGGAAVVMGALSPRTRNAQVEMFQNGEVDYLVATDAIGMGLNMDVAHVWFAGVHKFDGRGIRPLRNEELAQIAGRAGRHMTDGTFGTTADASPLSQEQVEAIERHRFDPVRAIQWRSADLDFRSIAALIDSLNAPPSLPGLQRAREADDQLALAALMQRAEIADAARSHQRVRLLWDICQVPDFRKTMSEEHTALLAQLFRYLTSPLERLPEDWVDGHIKRLERYDGDIDTLMSRIAHTRTWTYISHRSGWLERTAHWQERTRAIEDRLSDALHQRLTQRFVDRRTALLVRKLKLPEELMTGVSETGEVTVEGERLGRIEGFRFAPETARDEADQRTVLSAALRALRQELPARLEKFANSPDAAIGIDDKLRLTWGGGAIARLLPGPDPLSPKVEPLSSDLLDGPAREAVRKRCADWIEASIRKSLPDLMAAREAELSGAARGVVFQLGEALGAMARAPLEEQIAAMTDADRKALARAGIRLGVYTVFIPTMLKPGAIRTRALLWTIFRGKESIPPLPAEGRTSIVVTPDMDRDFLAAVGYLPMGDRAIRADMVERLAWVARNAVRASRDAHRAWQEGSKAPPPAAPATAGATSSDGVVTEWMIAAAALGEAVEPTADTPSGGAAGATPAEPPAETAAPAAPPPIWTRGSPETGGAIPVAETFSSASRVWTLAEAPKAASGATILTPERPTLPPGHFRVTPEMLSLIGCGEAEMTVILRALGYRVHQPPEDAEGPTTFSIRPRFQRERDEQRGHDRRGPPPEWKRRRHGEQGPAEGRDGRRPRRERRHDGPAPQDGPPPAADAAAPAGEDRRPPRRDRGPREERRDRPEGGGKFGGPQGERRFGPRRDRDRESGPEVRLVATTEKKGDRPAADSPFAKLLELKLGKQ